MEDNDQNNDEYQFTELDSLGNEIISDDEEPGLHTDTMSSDPDSGKKDIRRNALIVVGLIIAALILYKIIGSWYSKKSDVSKKTTTPVAQQITQQPVQTVITPAPIEQPQQIISQVDTDLKQKVSAIEISQQTVRAQVNSLGDDVNAVNSNVNNLNTQVSKLNQLIEDLSNQLARQTEEINQLRVRTKPKRVHHTPSHRAARIVYYIQAVIPGRAWLIGSNGSTLTVREGTKIPGYGVVKLIDSIQGVILTSSGQAIRFSQEDS